MRFGELLLSFPFEIQREIDVVAAAGVRSLKPGRNALDNILYDSNWNFCVHVKSDSRLNSKWNLHDTHPDLPQLTNLEFLMYLFT